MKTNKNRTLEISGAIPIPLSKDVNFSYIYFNQENIIKQAFKKIGEKAWVGGTNFNRDCSRFIMDIFKSFRIYLPRDTKHQENYIPAPKISFTHNIKERRKV